MRRITPKMHGIIDYLLVLFLWLSPTLFNVSSIAIFLYILGFLHLFLSILTNYPLSLIKIVSFPVHGWFEFLIGAILIFLPWIAGFAEESNSKIYSICLGVFILTFWMFSNYRQKEADNYSSTGKVKD